MGHEASITDRSDAGHGLVLNPLTLAEVLVVPVRRGGIEPVLAALRDLEVRELPFPAEDRGPARDTAREHRAPMPECCVLLAAEDAAARLASFDEQLTRAARDLELDFVGR